MFEKAFRMKLRFATPRGQVSVEDLWDMPLTDNGGFDLDSLAINLDQMIKDSGEGSFVKKDAKIDPGVKLRFDIVKHIIDIRLSEDEARKKRADNRRKRQEIMSLMKQKQDEEMKSKDLDALQKMLDELGEEDID